MKLEKQDIQILKLLQRDATLSTASIAEQINVSQSPCWRRINRLEQQGLIRGRDNDQPAYHFNAAIGSRHPAAEPAVHAGEIEYEPKVKLELKRAPTSGGCG